LAFERSVGIVVGLAAEARIARRLGCAVAIGGGTAAGAEAAARRLIEGGASALVSFGLAGGLDPALRAGTLIVPSAVLADGAHYATDPRLSHCLGGQTGHVILGADSVAAGVEHKRTLWRESGAAAIDLESGAVARIAASRCVKFAVLRAICDPAERALPPAALAALDAEGTIAVRRVLATLFAQPGQLSALIRLAADAAAARRALLTRVRLLAQASPPLPAATPR
jgi:adenosylhomocysteine nucleosidase